MSSEALRAAYLDLQQRGGIADLSDRTRLTLAGNDRVRYLNGQVTANVAKINVGQARPACITTAKGKLCAEVVITAQADRLIVDGDASLAETLRTRLERYIIADDVTVDELPSTERLVHFLVQPPELGGGVEISRFGVRGWDAVIAAEDWERRAAGRVIAGADLLEVLRLEAGLPRWGRELDENTLPPEAKLEASHIDYHKGCYVGQEVISRLKSVGHVNRVLTGFTADAPIPEGAEIVSKAAPEQICGKITSAGWSFALERSIALGYLRRSAAVDDLIARPTDPGRAPVPITTCALPFTK